jgi:glycosyltransferase involved in cell wall biosynthesis
MKVALVHDYLNQSGGAERVIAALHRIFPDAPIFTTLADPAVISELIPDAKVVTSWMQALPGTRRHYRKFFLLYPAAVASLDLTGFDLVISNSSAYVKSVRTRPDACHLCYCHTPMRFAWDFERYAAREEWGRWTRRVLQPLVELLRRWDHATAHRPTAYFGNSSAVATRIERCYGRPAGVLHPPVEVDRFAPGNAVGDEYLVVSRLVAYKRIDLAIDAFNQLGRPLAIVGDGPARASLQRAAGPTIRFLGRLDDAEVARMQREARGLIFPGEEDFGITPLEANASGRPVVAFAAGGALDTVVDGVTGIFFREQTADALARAVGTADGVTWDADVLRQHAERFSESVFRERVAACVDEAMAAGLRLRRDFDHHRTVGHADHDRRAAASGA